MLHDLVVDCDLIHTGRRTLAGRVVVDDGKVSALVPPGEVVNARNRIDASGKQVIPGVIDTHCHFRDPGFTHKEDIASATRLAALGGVTCVYDMPNTQPAVDSLARLEEHREHFAARSFVDFGHNVSPVKAGDMRGMADAGATAFKIWTSYDIGRSYPHVNSLAVTDTRQLYETFELARDVGLPVYVHPSDHGLYAMFAERSRAEWGVDFRSYARALRRGGGVTIDLSIATLLELQRSVGNRLHILHLSSERGIEMVAAAKTAGRPVTAETNPFAMFLSNDWETIERVGPFALGQWVPDKDAAAMWDAVRDGVIDVIASDHAPHTREEKEPGWKDMYAAPGGAGPFVGHYLGLLLDAVYERRLSMQRLVELCCTAPAELTGTAGTKGVLEPGADADLVVVDTSMTKTLSASDIPYKCGWLANEGRLVHGWPITTILRGRTIADGGRVLVAEGAGRFVSPGR
jgi:dihydroorotase (multifunctional complex type)